MTENLLHRIAEQLDNFYCHNSRSHQFEKIRDMSRVFFVSLRTDDELRAALRKTLPVDLSPAFLTDAERLVDEAGQSLRENLYSHFSTALDAELRRQRYPSGTDHDQFPAMAVPST